MKTVIWDYNGTILNDVQMCLKIENLMLEKRRMPIWPQSMETYREQFCFPVIDYYKKMGYTFETETYEDISVEFNMLYKQYFHECTLTQGFMDKIHESIEKGYRNVILSASRQDVLLEQCRLLKIDPYFEQILGIDNFLAGSKVAMAQNWFSKEHVQPDDCIYIGDTLHDMETANALHINAYWLVACGHQSYTVLKEKSDRVVHSLREVQL